MKEGKNGIEGRKAGRILKEGRKEGRILKEGRNIIEGRKEWY